ncbi:MAG TPA: thioesterase family protein [Blastocatellia bacterium]|nr:thioesterase family protein [Blastocatellia bacterium]
MPYRTRLAVRFGDVDRAGIVYFPRIFHYMHVAQEDFFGEYVGVPYHRLVEEEGVGFPTVSDATDFLGVIRYGDVLDIRVFISRVGDSSATFEFRIHREATGELLVRASQVKVAVNMQSWQKVSIPDRLRLAFASCKEE